MTAVVDPAGVIHVHGEHDSSGGTAVRQEGDDLLVPVDVSPPLPRQLSSAPAGATSES